jgi:hypothetical protein
VDDGSYDAFTSVHRPRAQSSTQLRPVERIFEKPKLRVGQFTAFVHAGSGRETDLSPLAWFDRKLTDNQIQDLSPADREKYFQDQANAGVHDGGLIGWVGHGGAVRSPPACE